MDPIREAHELEAEALLRRARPEPSPASVNRLEYRLLGAPRRSTPRRHWRPLAVGGALTTAMAAAVLLAGLGGGGPLGPAEEVTARDDCRIVLAPRREREVFVIRGRDDEPTLTTRWRTERRPVERCD